MTERPLCTCSFWTGRAGHVHYRREGCIAPPTTADMDATHALIVDFADRAGTAFQPVVDALSGIVRDLGTAWAALDRDLNVERKP